MTNNLLHEANRRSWDAVSPDRQANIDARGQWQRVAADPRLVLSSDELAYLGHITGKQICVLGSGDNLVVFALAGLGAQVTSVDISQVQLDIAAGRSRQLGLDVAFVRADVTDLSSLVDGTFDVVYTGGHVAVWVSDLPRYYAEAGRVLKPDGLFLINEYHPFRRIWKYGSDRLELAVDYFDRGPHPTDRSDEVPDATPASLPGYEFHWTIDDFVSSLLGAGCELLALRELGDQVEDWEITPFTGLPQSLLLVGRKR